MNTVLRARCSALLIILVTCVATSPVLCQTDRVANQLDSEFKGRILLLRAFYSGNDLEYDQTGVLRGTATEGPWTLANVEITKITFTAQGIAIVGNRIGTLYRGGKPGFIKVGKLKIQVTKPNPDADTEATLHQLFSKIFMESGEDLRPLVPEYWQSYLAGSDSKSRSAAWRATFVKDKNQVFTKSDAMPGEVSAPHVVYWKDPNYTKEAASHHIEGTSHLGAIIDSTGIASDIAILEPLGMGLDEQAILAIRQWKFQPGMKNGKPVRVQIEIQTDFRCCP
jgi:TonB family protein